MVYASQEEPLQPLQQEDVLMEESTSGLVTRDSTIPTPTEAYEAMIALKDRDEYKEGTTWTNDEPYSDTKGNYHWKGGPLDGKNISAVGCVAFAFILSDEAFGSLPARMYATGNFTFEDIKVGDILRVNNDAHTVIVLEVSEAGVVVAEGNISTGDHKGKVHWGRAISKEEVMSNTSHYITRYPKDYIPPEDPEANVSIASGTLEGGLTWNLTKAGTLTISGKGAMPDFSAVGEQPWIENNSKIKKVVIGNGVTSIGSCAFWECGVLSVEISPSVTTINNSAFRSSSIISVNIPSSVKTIGDSAFRACQNLSSVTISEGLEKIEQNAFNACANLTSIALPASIGEVGAAAFFQCQNMTSATFAPGSKQVKLGDNLFTQCYYLSSVTLPKSIDCISEGMFQNCLMLTRVEIPQGAESIGMSAFASCSRLTTVVIPDSVGTIGISAFASSLLTDIYFTGTEAQWKSISKLGDTAMVVSKATMHYNYIPPTSPDPDDTEKADISRATMTLSQTSYTYDGKAKTPSVTVKLDGKTLVLNTDYTVSYSNNTNVGTAKVTITGKGNYTGSKTADFTITKAAETEKADISRVTMTLSQTSYTYDGKAKTPSVTVKLDGKTLVFNADYTISYSNNTKVGTAKVTITGKGNYMGSKTASFTIKKADISKATMTLSQTSYTYNGKAKTPSVTVKLDGKTLALNTDYTISYSNNTKVGTAKVTITGKGNYTGKKTVSFTIKKAATVSITCKKTLYKVAYGTKPFKINASSKSKMTFTSSKPKIAAVNKDTGKVTIKNTGIATITIKAGKVSKKVTIEVSPKKPSVKSAQAVKGKKLTVKWAKDKMASGYQVQVSTDKKFKKDMKSKKISKTSYTFTKLKIGKKYYVRLRSYKESDKGLLYGTWSKVKLSSKIKK